MAGVPLLTRRATVHLAQRVARALTAGDLLVMSGDLGSGKTFFARAICRALGVPTGVRITSPTFSLVHELAGRLPIRHADLYRIRDRSELVELALVDDRAAGAVLLVEWGLPYVHELGGDALVLAFRSLPDGSRAVEASATGPRSEVLARAAAAVGP